MKDKKSSRVQSCKFCGATLPRNAKCCLSCGTSSIPIRVGQTHSKLNTLLSPLTGKKPLKVWALLTFFLILAVVVGGALHAPTGDNATTSSIVSSSHALNSHRIVCVGDSITQGFTSPNNWPYHLKARLGGNWEVINQGVGGYKTADMLNHIGSAIALNPHFVVIMGGTNDLANGAVPLTTIQEHIKAISTRVESSGAVPVLCTVTPTSYHLTERGSLNAWITEFAHAKGYPLIDFYKALESPSNPGCANSSLVMSDGVHPTAAGCVVMANAIDLTIFTGGR